MSVSKDLKCIMSMDSFVERAGLGAPDPVRASTMLRRVYGGRLELVNTMCSQQSRRDSAQSCLRRLSML